MRIQAFRDEFLRYRQTGERALAQVPDAALNRRLGPDGNSVATLVRHIGGNLASRFTDFLTADGEKPWRHRDAEFEDRDYARAEVTERWEAGWRVLESQLAALTDADLDRTVRIRSLPLTVHEALCRSTAHTAYHVGQIVLLARLHAQGPWGWISVPKGKSADYNLNPTKERRPGG